MVHEVRTQRSNVAQTLRASADLVSSEVKDEKVIKRETAKLANWELLKEENLGCVALVAKKQWKDEVRPHHVAFVAAIVGLFVA